MQNDGVLINDLLPRLLQAPRGSFFLFGARGTGKSTWLRGAFPGAHTVSLLDEALYQELLGDPSRFADDLRALAPQSWVVVDEVQRLPALLNEVHGLIADHGARYRFALSGSSARKLRRLDVNLLAGRAIRRTFFPLVSAELDFRFDVDDVLAFGTLPAVRSEPAHAVDILDAYVGTYLQEEIRQEALVKDLERYLADPSVGYEVARSQGAYQLLENLHHQAGLPPGDLGAVDVQGISERR